MSAKLKQKASFLRTFYFSDKILFSFGVVFYQIFIHAECIFLPLAAILQTKFSHQYV
jgi:hypothetical protein